MLHEDGLIEVVIPRNTDPEKKAEVEGFVFQINNNPNAQQSFAQAADAAGLLEKKQPPYLLIGGALLLSYFLFFK